MGDVQESCVCTATKGLPTKRLLTMVMSESWVTTRNTTIWSMTQYKGIEGKDQADISLARTQMIKKVTLDAVRLKIETFQVEQVVLSTAIFITGMGVQIKIVNFYMKLRQSAEISRMGLVREGFACIAIKRISTTDVKYFLQLPRYYCTPDRKRTRERNRRNKVKCIKI